MKRYFKLIEIKQPFKKHQIDEYICPNDGDMLMSNTVEKLEMLDWDEYEYTSDLSKIEIYKCVDDNCSQFYIVFEGGNTKYEGTAGSPMIWK